MKNTLLIVLAIATCGLGVVCIAQYRQAAAQKTELAAVRTELDANTQQLEDSRAAEKRAAAQSEELARKMEELAARTQPGQAGASLAASAGPGGKKAPTATKPDDGDKSMAGFGKMLSKMMDDPEMKKMIRDQQRQMLDPLYAPLIKKMGMTPEEAGKFKDLIADTQMNGASKATSLMDGSTTNRSELMSAISEQQKNSDEQVKQLLGDDRYAQYKDYQQTVGERMQLSQFQQQNAASSNPINEQQTEQLLSFMKEEKLTVAAATGQTLPGAANNMASLEAMTSPDQMEKMMQSQEMVNQRVYDRAKEVLLPDQLQSFGGFQGNQLKMMRLGMSMAQKMFVPNNAQGGAASQDQ